LADKQALDSARAAAQTLLPDTIRVDGLTPSPGPEHADFRAQTETIDALKKRRQDAKERQYEMAEPRKELDSTLGQNYVETSLTPLIEKLEALDSGQDKAEVIFDLKRIRDALNQEKNGDRRDMVALATAFGDIDTGKLAGLFPLIGTDPGEFLDTIREAQTVSAKALNTQMSFGEQVGVLIYTTEQDIKTNVMPTVMDHLSQSLKDIDYLIKTIQILSTTHRVPIERQELGLELRRLMRLHEFIERTVTDYSLSTPSSEFLVMERFRTAVSSVMTQFEINLKMHSVPEDKRKKGFEEYHAAVDNLLDLKEEVREVYSDLKEAENVDKGLKDFQMAQDDAISRFNVAARSPTWQARVDIPSPTNGVAVSQVLNSLRQVLSNDEGLSFDEQVSNQKNLIALTAVENEIQKLQRANKPRQIGILYMALSRLSLEEVKRVYPDFDLVPLQLIKQFTAERMQDYTDRNLMTKVAQASDHIVNAERSWTAKDQEQLSQAERSRGRLKSKITQNSPTPSPHRMTRADSHALENGPSPGPSPDRYPVNEKKKTTNRNRPKTIKC